MDTSPNTPATPAWFNTLAEKYQAGVSHAFILFMNINDLVAPGTTIRSFLNAALGSTCSVIAWYDRAQGITFPLPSMRTQFLQVTGFSSGPAPASGPLAALQGALPGGSAAPAQLPTEPERVLPLLERLLCTRATLPDDGDPLPDGVAPKYVVVIDWAEILVPATDLGAMSVGDRTALITLERWGRDPGIMSTGNIVILLVRNLSDLHPSLRAASARFEAIQIPLPDATVRRQFIGTYLAAKPADFTTLSASELTRQTGGLSLLHVEDIVLRAQYEYDRTAGRQGLTAALVQERKAQIIETEFGGILQILEPRRRFADIGGMAALKEYIQTVVITPMREGTEGMVDILPTGILFSGPPGTGKTAVSEAIAAEIGINFVLFAPGKLLGQYVGQSEANLERALAAIETLAPVGVFVDELDEAVRRGGEGDSGVSSRLFGRILAFMADPAHRGQILWIGATNFPNRLDPALKRPGRFGDLKLAILPPTADERPAIFGIHLRRYCKSEVPDLPPECVTLSEGWTGAEIEQAARKAAELRFTRKLDTATAIQRAMELVLPTTANVPAMIEEALDNVDDLELLPDTYRKLALARRKRPVLIEEPATPVQRGARRL
jgi:SpoVK/Ycf46/Vps4 family AAA+-type ATPase